MTSIVTTAVRDIAGALGGFATEVFEIRDSARKASADHAADHVADPARTRPEDVG